MSDLALTWNGETCDLALDGNDLLLEEGLQTAVLISLFSDRRARADDLLPGATDDRRGWWGDAWPEVEGDLIGSRLWLLSREKEVPEPLRKAREYAQEALAWLVDDGICARVEIAVSVPRRGVLGLVATLYRRDGRTENYQYDVIWEAL
jgi:phage gp46-like protein